MGIQSTRRIGRRSSALGGRDFYDWRNGDDEARPGCGSGNVSSCWMMYIPERYDNDVFTSNHFPVLNRHCTNAVTAGSACEHLLCVEGHGGPQLTNRQSASARRPPAMISYKPHRVRVVDNLAMWTVDLSLKWRDCSVHNTVVQRKSYAGVPQSEVHSFVKGFHDSCSMPRLTFQFRQKFIPLAIRTWPVDLDS